MNVIFTRGMQASGKTSWAKEFVKKNQDYKRVSRDDLRHMLSSYTFNKSNEVIVTLIEQNILNILAVAGYNIVIDKMNLNEHDFKNDIAYLKILFSKGEFTYEVKDFPVMLDEAIDRDSKREFPIGKDVLIKTYNKYKDVLEGMWTKNERKKIDYDPTLPTCIIVDIDGTLALNTGRNPYDMGRVMEDAPNQPVIDLLDMIANDFFIKKQKLTIFIFSGRDDIAEFDTREWLTKHDVPWTNIAMRRTGDKRKDCIVKQEMYERLVKGKYNVAYVIDDRKQVIDMWRENGLFVLDVAGHNF